MCIPDIDGDGDADTCLVCLPLMCILGYCCCRNCGSKDRNQPQPASYMIPGGGGALPQPGYGYPANPGQYGGYYPPPNQPGFGYGQQPAYPPQPGYVPGYPPGYNQPIYNPQPNFAQNYGQGLEIKPQAGSTIVSYVH